VKVRLYSTPQPGAPWALWAEIESLHNAEKRQSVQLTTAGHPPRFAYVDPASQRPQPHWQDTTRLPAQVQIDAQSNDNTPPWRLAVAPRRTVFGPCRFDAVSLACR
jgi:hypothetical protein